MKREAVKKLAARLVLAVAPLAGLLVLPTAHADDRGGAGYSNVPEVETHPVNNTSDARFYWLLTRPDQERPLVVWNFPLVRSQAITTCQRRDTGQSPMQALYALDQRYGGPYSFDDANSITSAAETIYCPWHNAPMPAGNWANTSAPMYPMPVYPPLAWSPTAAPYM